MHRTFVLATVLALAMLTALPAAAGHAAPLSPPPPQNVDVSQRPGNESETTIAVNPTNPENIVIVSNIAEGVSGMFAAVSFDGGNTWVQRIIGNRDNLRDACCDPSLSWDEYGNLFLTYLYNVENRVPVALSTDGGLSFDLIAEIAKPAPSTGPTANERRLFRFVDQPTITAAKGMAWLVFNAGGPMFAAGAAVTGLGQVDAFLTQETIPGTNNCTYGDVAIGPDGQVMQVCALTESGQGGGKLFVNVDPDGLGPDPFGGRIYVDSHARRRL